MKIITHGVRTFVESTQHKVRRALDDAVQEDNKIHINFWMAGLPRQSGLVESSDINVRARSVCLLMVGVGTGPEYANLSHIYWWCQHHVSSNRKLSFPSPSSLTPTKIFLA